MRQIDVIISGPSPGGDNSSSRKAYTWTTIEKCTRMEDNPKITFKEEETEYLDPSDDDALVVSVRIINARVKRIMINTGNFANILYFDSF